MNEKFLGVHDIARMFGDIILGHPANENYTVARENSRNLLMADLIRMYDQLFEEPPVVGTESVPFEDGQSTSELSELDSMKKTTLFDNESVVFRILDHDETRHNPRFTESPQIVTNSIGVAGSTILSDGSCYLLICSVHLSGLGNHKRLFGCSSGKVVLLGIELMG